MDTNTDITSVLKSIPLFLDFNANQLQELSGMCKLIEIDPGDVPIKEGAPLDFVYILLDGEIRVDVFIPSKGNIETSRLGPLDILGWSALTPVVRQRTGTTTAITHCWLLRIDGQLLTQLCEKDHDIGFRIYHRIANVAARSFLTTRLQMMNLIVNGQHQ
jgi:CRP/FNR family transcriptional regulator, cyclic AMP receptor protein